jgi:hypothetical protein
MEWLIGIVGGEAGGIGAGAAAKQNKLGPIINGILGAVGGAGGSALIQSLLAGGAGLDLVAIAGNLVGGGVAGGIVSTVVGLIVNAVKKK